jgi:hypothetical protein
MIIRPKSVEVDGDVLGPRILQRRGGTNPWDGACLDGVDLTGEPGSPAWAPEELQDRPWDSLGLWYRPDWAPLLVNVNHVNDRPALVAGSLFASDVRRMREALSEFPRPSSATWSLPT